MCEPATISMAIGVGASIAGAATKAVGEAQAGAAGLEVARQNGLIARAAAQSAMERGNYQAAITTARGSELLGKERAAYGASGVVANKGSPLDVMADTGFITGMDATTIHNNAAREAWGMTQEAQAGVQRAQYAKQAADFSAGSTLLTGATGIASGLLDYSGGFNGLNKKQQALAQPGSIQDAKAAGLA